MYGKTFPAFPFSPATATVADGTEQQRYNGTAQRNGEMATAEWQWNGGNQAQR